MTLEFVPSGKKILIWLSRSYDKAVPYFDRLIQLGYELHMERKNTIAAARIGVPCIKFDPRAQMGQIKDFDLVVVEIVDELRELLNLKGPTKDILLARYEAGKPLLVSVDQLHRFLEWELWNREATRGDVFRHLFSVDEEAISIMEFYKIVEVPKDKVLVHQ